MEILEPTLNWNYKTEISNSYIITIKNHKNSEIMGQRCLESCNRVGQKAVIWDAFDGTGEKIKVPEHARNTNWLKWLKLTNYSLTKPEICCWLSHFSLWCKCIEEDMPLVALEHDAIMLQPFTHHNVFNSIVYLGSSEQVKSNYWNPIPPHAQMGHNYRYILRTHAYSIDPLVAKNLVSHAIERGIYTAVDVMMKMQEFSIVSFGIFAADMAGETTIYEHDSPYKV
jgi:GR25 family glycosyltransferase involved in LPS biosynthesis